MLLVAAAIGLLWSGLAGFIVDVFVSDGITDGQNLLS